MNIADGIKVAVNVIKVLSLAVEVADRFVDVLHKAGYLKNTNDVDDLGAKAIWGDEHGIKESEFDDYKTYMEEIDSIDITEAEKSKYSAVEMREKGCEIVVNGINKLYGSKAEQFVSEAVNHVDFYTRDGRIETYMEAVLKYDLPIDDIGKYFNNKLDDLQYIKRFDMALNEAECSLGANKKEAVEILDKEMGKRVDD